MIISNKCSAMSIELFDLSHPVVQDPWRGPCRLWTLHLTTMMIGFSSNQIEDFPLFLLSVEESLQ